jgi:hypothetical protein
MAHITTSKVLAELTHDELRIIRFSLSQVLGTWTIPDADRRTAEDLLDDLGGAPV